MEETLCHLEYFATEGEWSWKCYFCRHSHAFRATLVSLRIHVSSLGSAWLFHRRMVVSCRPRPHLWCSVPLAVTRVEAPDQLCSVTYTGTPQLLTRGTRVRQVHT